MTLKLVRHRLYPVIGFENSQFKFHHAKFNALLTACSKRRAQGCLAWPNASGHLSTACAARPSLHAWRPKKPTFFQHLTPTSSLPGQGETVAGGRRQNSVGAGGVLMEEEGTRPTTEGEGRGWRPKRRRKRVPCHAFIQHSRTTDQC